MQLAASGNRNDTSKLPTDQCTVCGKATFVHSQSRKKGEYYQFPELISDKDDITTDVTRRHNDHFDNLRIDLENQFDDALAIEKCD